MSNYYGIDDDMHEEMASQDDIIREQRDRITALEAEIATLKAEINRLERVEETRNAQISRVEAEVKKVQAISDQLVDRLFSDIATLKAQKVEMQKCLSDHHKRESDKEEIGLPDGNGGWIPVDMGSEYADSTLFKRTENCLKDYFEPMA